jgi:SAM-dependent methyltransferase
MTDQLTSDIIQWDVNAWSEALKYWDKNVDWSKVQNGLELGGREGGLSLWLAKKGIKTVCSDLHDVKNAASPLHQKHHVSGLITYQDIDATNIPYENHFDVIAFKSIIGGIGRNNNIESQKKTFKEIHKALKPGGKLLFAENLTASPFHRQLRKRFVRWGSEWRYITIGEMKMFLKDFPCSDIKTTGFLSVFGRSENQRNMLSSIDKLILNRISPDSWKYIVYGIAEK